MKLARGIALLAGLGLLATGVWAFASPASFYRFATYPPFSLHFVHDIGAFLMGLGAVLLLALRFDGAMFVALAGNAAAGWLHAVSHLIDRRLGGGSWRDPVFTLAVAVALTAGAAGAWRATHRRSGGAP